MSNLNYKHLQYFREVARAGSIVVAAERHHVTPQTISGQLTLLEDRIGQKLSEGSAGGWSSTRPAASRCATRTTSFR